MKVQTQKTKGDFFKDKHKWLIVGVASVGTALFAVLGSYYFQPSFVPQSINKKVKTFIDESILGKESSKSSGSDTQSGNEPTNGSESQSGGQTTQSVDTSNWQTYTNTQAGYEFKYPEGWVATEKTDEFKQGIGVNNSDTLSYQIVDPIYDDIEKTRMIIETKKSYGSDEDVDRAIAGLVYSEKKEIEINNKKAILIKGSAVDFETEQVVSNFTMVVFSQNNKIYILHYIRFVNDVDELQKEFEVIYNSFVIN